MKYPVIATRGVIVFPGHQSLLEVGRKISLHAIDLSIIQNEAKLVIVSQRDPMMDAPSSAKDLFTYGTLVSIKVEKEQPTGTKTISVYGLNRVALSNFNFSKELIEVEANIKKSKVASEESEQQFIASISSQLDQVLGGMMNMPKDVLSSLASGISASELADVVGHYMPIPFDQKQELLETIDIDKRLELVNSLMLQSTQMAGIDKNLDDQVRQTLDTQQKEFLLRERMKAIKEELGDISSKESDVDEWRKKLQDKKYPKELRAKALEEIKRYESMPPISAEANVSKGYIDWLVKLPWRTYSEDNQDLSKAKSVLEKHHYGIKKVKERIIEHLAVKINTKSFTAPILTLVGPPGVGKTSFAKSIAEAVGREFIKVSLGGLRDEAEIRGHRRTYVGAMPGKIIQAMNKAKTSNPVILLDEIDKMASDYKGDPTSAMLEVLDPEQNTKFQDHYLEVEYDLSKVMFVATANYYDQIPGPLLDRVETIWLDQYTSEEKLAIAKKYIIPEILKSNGIKKTFFQISDKVLEYVIAKYTQEAGVRGLQRIIDKLARKVVVGMIEKKFTAPFTITQERVLELLGKEQVVKEILKGKAEVGLVNGMYYSSVGGGILPIEVTTYPSKNPELQLTGSIKDVMKESLNIAVGYLRANAKKFGIDFGWDTHTIQVHVPEGAMPKDGPSAGLAFATAVASALTGKPVPKDISITGEITLRGKALIIGGLKEKSLGAVEAGVKTIYTPKQNERDYDELPEKVKKVAKLVPVENFEQLFDLIFKK